MRKREGLIEKKRLIDVVREYISVKEIAAEVGVSVRVINYWLSGQKKPGKKSRTQLEGLAKQFRGGEVEEKKDGIEKPLVVTPDYDSREQGVPTTPAQNFKADLDVLDVDFTRGLATPFFDVAFAVQTLMWDKGKVISERVGGVSEPAKINWSDSSKQTGRSDKSLKKWFVLYKNTPDRAKFEEIAKKKVQEQTAKWIKGIEAATLPEPKEKKLGEGEGNQEERTPKESMLYCLAEHYDSKDAMWSQVEDCHKCPMLTLCRQIGEIVDKDPRFRVKK